MHVITRSCVLFFWMHTLTFVKSQEPLPDCTLQDFLNGPLFDSNFDTTGLEASYVAGRQIRVSCSTGYSGFFLLFCIEGKWQSRGTKCQPQQCPVIHVSNNVQVIGDPEEANVGNVVRFSCKSNSEILIGSQEIYCNENGEWSGEAPTCKAPLACEQPPPLENGDTKNSMKFSYRHNERVEYICQNYYTMQGGPFKTCNNGEWTGEIICLTPLDCEQPPPLANGDTKNSMKFSYRHNERVEYICQNYYTMQGGPFKTCNNGEWTGEIICLRPCTVDEEAMRGRNIRFRYGRKDKLYSTHGDEIEFSCTRGRPVGSWGMRPMCVDGVVHLPSCQ